MVDSYLQEIKENYNTVLQAIEKTAIAAGRNPADIHLVVVSKFKPVEAIEAAYQAGARFFGENYPEQTLPKIDALNQYSSLEWHMIGHLQSRKAKIIADHFSLFHSLDSYKLAEKLHRLMSERQRSLRVLLEVNVSGEDSKGGWNAWRETDWPELAAEIEPMLALTGLQIEGLMTMPPLFSDPEKSRPIFVKLRKLQEYLMKRLGESYWKDLSIGTSHDYPVAIQEGARYVRIGQAILGRREN